MSRVRELVEHAAKLEDDRKHAGALAAQAYEPSLAFQADKERLVNIARGCHDYGGGYRDGRESEIFHHGIQTVINALGGALQGDDDLQIRVLESVGRTARRPVSPHAHGCLDDAMGCEVCQHAARKAAPGGTLGIQKGNIDAAT